VRHWFEHNGERVGAATGDGVPAGEPVVATGSRPPADVKRGKREVRPSGDLRIKAAFARSVAMRRFPTIAGYMIA
jgi:hypothetical protein